MACPAIPIMVFTAAALSLMPIEAAAQTSESRPGPAAARKGWDDTVKGRSLVTPVEIGFDLAPDYRDFAAGKLPITFVLHNAASGQTIRIAPETVARDFRSAADRRAITFLIAVDNLAEPLWDKGGCTDVWTSAERDGRGVTVSLTYAACNSPQAAAFAAGNPIGGIIVKGGHNRSQRTAGNPIGGIIVKGGKNPGGNLRVVTGGSYTGDGAEQQLRARTAEVRDGAVVILTASSGAGSPRRTGF